MKLAFICEHFDPLRSGHDRLTVWFALALAQRGVEVHVVCHDAKRLNPYRAAHQGASHEAHLSARAYGHEHSAHVGIHIHRLPGLKLSTTLGFRSFGRQARQWCRQHHVDVVHSFTLAYPGDLFFPLTGVVASLQEAAVAARPLKRASVWKRLLLRMPGKPRTLLTLERRAAVGDRGHKPWRIVCTSPHIARGFQDHYEVPTERLVVLPPPLTNPLPDLQQAPVDRAWFRGHYHLGPTDPVALFVGHDFRRQGLRWAIEALAHSQTPWHLLVVGLGKFREYLELAERLQLSERVKFIGPTQDLARLYPAADVLLLPTLYDAVGLAALEALSYGLPIISTCQLGCAHLIEQHQLGTIVSTARDVSALAQALDHLPLAGREHDALALRARQFAGTLDPEAFLERWLALYQACLQGRG